MVIVTCLGHMIDNIFLHIRVTNLFLYKHCLWVTFSPFGQIQQFIHTAFNVSNGKTPASLKLTFIKWWLVWHPPRATDMKPEWNWPCKSLLEELRDVPSADVHRLSFGLVNFAVDHHLVWRRFYKNVLHLLLTPRTSKLKQGVLTEGQGSVQLTSSFW
jgi:hypothetical protein